MPNKTHKEYCKDELAKCENVNKTYDIVAVTNQRVKKYRKKKQKNVKSRPEIKKSLKRLLTS